MMKDMVFGIFRHLITAGGGVLVAKGQLTDAQAVDVVGAVMVLIGIGWSMWEKKSKAPAQ